MIDLPSACRTLLRDQANTGWDNVPDMIYVLHEDEGDWWFEQLYALEDFSLEVLYDVAKQGHSLKRSVDGIAICVEVWRHPWLHEMRENEEFIHKVTVGAAELGIDVPEGDEFERRFRDVYRKIVTLPAHMNKYRVDAKELFVLTKDGEYSVYSIDKGKDEVMDGSSLGQFAAEIGGDLNKNVITPEIKNLLSALYEGK